MVGRLAGFYRKKMPSDLKIAVLVPSNMHLQKFQALNDAGAFDGDVDAIVDPFTNEKGLTITDVSSGEHDAEVKPVIASEWPSWMKVEDLVGHVFLMRTSGGKKYQVGKPYLMNSAVSVNIKDVSEFILGSHFHDVVVR